MVHCLIANEVFQGIICALKRRKNDEKIGIDLTEQCKCRHYVSNYRALI